MTEETEGGLPPQAEPNLTPEGPAPAPAGEVQPLQPPTGPDQVLTSTPAPGASWSSAPPPGWATQNSTEYSAATVQPVTVASSRRHDLR